MSQLLHNSDEPIANQYTCLLRNSGRLPAYPRTGSHRFFYLVTQGHYKDQQRVKFMSQQFIEGPNIEVILGCHGESSVLPIALPHTPRYCCQTDGSDVSSPNAPLHTTRPFTRI